MCIAVTRYRRFTFSSSDFETSLLNDPRVLIVDEPTAGLDPEERVRFRNILSDIARERIVISSSLLFIRYMYASSTSGSAACAPANGSSSERKRISARLPE